MISITGSTYTPYNRISKTTTPEATPDVVLYPEIFGGKIGKKVYSYLKDVHAVVRYYKIIPVKTLRILLLGITKLTGLQFDSCVVNGLPKFYHPGSKVTVLFSNSNAKFRRKKDGKTVTIYCKKGTAIVTRDRFDEFWTYTPPKHLVVTYFSSHLLPLRDIYLNQKLRDNFLEVVRDKLNKVRELPLGKQCVQKYVTFDKMLGKGDYGNVYLSSLNNMEFAVKLAKLKPGAVDRPYSRFNTSWAEVLIMRDILRPLIQNGVCPNLPLLIDSFVCGNCNLTIRNKTQEQPCVITITELADGSFRDFVKVHEPTEEELYSALFQIMLALHAVQLNGQIMNYDVKADNVLFYNVTPGGYWEYVVHGKTFYVPNLGKLFVLNDFGISRPLSPDFQLYREPTDLTFRLGSRFGIVKNGKFTPLDSPKDATYKGTLQASPVVKWSSGKKSKGGQYRLFQKSQEIIDNGTKLTKSQVKLVKHSNPLDKAFFLQPEVVPPFEFYNDLQDAIRTFIGGKRTTQRGKHKRYPVVTDKMYKKLEKYNGKGDSLTDRVFSTDAAQVLAGYFIEKFFTKEYDYHTTRPEGKLLEKYVVS